MYHFREMKLKSSSIEKKVLVIEFTDPKKAIVAEFLMTDASLISYEVLDIIEDVLSGTSNYKTFSGNRCSLEINKDTTQIEDLLTDVFEGFDTYPAYEINTIRLKELIIVWKNENNKYSGK